MVSNEEMLIRVHQQHEVVMQSFREITKIRVISIVDLLRTARILDLPVLVPVIPKGDSQLTDDIYPIEKISKLKPYIFDGANHTVYVYLE